MFQASPLIVAPMTKFIAVNQKRKKTVNVSLEAFIWFISVDSMNNLKHSKIFDIYFLINNYDFKTELDSNTFYFW